MSTEDGGFQEPTAPAWMATFGDLMSLLLTFFVLLMSFASMDVRRFASVVGSMRDAFGIQTVHAGRVEAISTSVVNLSKSESTPYLQVIDVPARGSQQEQELLARLRMTIRNQKLERVVQVENSKRGVVLRLPGQLLFDPGSAELRPESLIFLREVAVLVGEMPDQVAIEGHTDDTPVGGDDDRSNWEISAARAVAALRYVVEVGDADPARLRATGFGATRPLVPNYGDEERQQNRRVEFVFLRPGPETVGPAPDGQPSQPSQPSQPEDAASQPEAAVGQPEKAAAPEFRTENRNVQP